MITLPSERVAIDLVGLLPKARGGCEYLLTCMDVATRWPEVVALSKTTASVILLLSLVGMVSLGSLYLIMGPSF